MNETENTACRVTGDAPKWNGKRLLRDITGVSGIYKIVNKISGKYYVGSSNDINGPYGRWYEHINNLKANRHDNDHLQKSWNKYGEVAFEFIIIKEVPPNKLLTEEQIYLNVASSETDKTYNMNFLSTGGGGFTGHRHTKESKQKTSLKLMGRTSPMKGRKNPTIIGDKNPQWKHVNSNTKNTLMEIYKTNGYSALKKKAKSIFNIGSTVTYRLAIEFKKTLRIPHNQHYQPSV